MAIKNKKQKLMVSAVAGAMAATIAVGGGTFAYLQGQTNEVVNQFDPNKVEVSIDESANHYEIIPGTVDSKDPKLTVSCTLPSFLFVTITEENIAGLVEYDVADGWTKLDGVEGNVYYRMITPDTDATTGKYIETTKEYKVLKDDQVKYPASVTSMDMTKDYKLSFQGFAIQAQPFLADADLNTTDAAVLSAAALRAYNMTPVEVASQEELNDAVANASEGSIIKLAAGTYELPADIPEGVTIEGEDPDETKVDASAWFNTSASNPVVADVKNVTFVQPDGKDQIVKGAIEGTFENCVFDNGSEFKSMYGVVQTDDLIFKDCKFKADAYACNFSSTKGTLLFENCEFTGWNSFGSGGKVVMDGCTFHKSASYGALRFYQDAEVKNCTFDAEFADPNDDAFIDANNSNITITFTNCIGLNTDKIYDNTNYPTGYVPDNITWIVDGVTLTRRAKH